MSSIKSSKSGGRKVFVPRQYDVKSDRQKDNKQRIIGIEYDDEDAAARLPFFAHLPQYAQRAQRVKLAVGFSRLEVHPAIVQLGLRLAEGIVDGDDERATATLSALCAVIRDYEPPAGRTLDRDLVERLKTPIQFLVDCRPLSVAQAAAIRYLKVQIGCTAGLSATAARDAVLESARAFVADKIVAANHAVGMLATTKIVDGDVIMTFGASPSVEAALLRARAANTRFRVIVLDGRRAASGRMLRRLVDAGIETEYALISAASYAARDATKAMLAADAMFTNGAALGRSGTALVAAVANAFRRPVLFLCPTYRFSSNVQIDSIAQNEFADPSRALAHGEAPLGVSSMGLVYDVTPLDCIDIVVTEVGLVPPSSVPVIIREVVQPSGMV